MRDEWIEEMADRTLEQARLCEREARRLRGIAAKMLHPPAGTSVEYAGYNCVRFITPVEGGRG